MTFKLLKIFAYILTIGIFMTPNVYANHASKHKNHTKNHIKHHAKNYVYKNNHNEKPY